MFSGSLHERLHRMQVAARDFFCTAREVVCPTLAFDQRDNSADWPGKRLV